MPKPRKSAKDYLPPFEAPPLADLPQPVQSAYFEAYAGYPPIVLTLPFPPSANRYWRHFRGHNVRSKEADKYIDLVKLYVRQQFPAFKPMERDVKALFYFYRFNAARDLNNCIKVLEDALQGAAYVNDNQIADSRQIRDYDNERPRVHVVLHEMTPADFGKIKSRR